MQDDSYQQRQLSVLSCSDREIEQHGQRLVQENKGKMGLSWQRTSSISNSLSNIH